jgi:hypothetical protein
MVELHSLNKILHRDPLVKAVKTLCVPLCDERGTEPGRGIRTEINPHTDIK